MEDQKKAVQKETEAILSLEGSHTLESILKVKFPNAYPNYYKLIVELNHKLGVEFYPKHIVDKTIGASGYQACLQFAKGNKLNEKPGIQELVSPLSPADLSDCYRTMTKKLLYMLLNVNNLSDKI